MITALRTLPLSSRVPALSLAAAVVVSAVTLASGSGCGEDIPDATALPPSSLKLLRSFEYKNSVRDIFDGRAEVTAELPEDLVRANFSSISASMDCYDDVSVEQFETIALEVAAQAFSRSPTPLDDFECTPTSVDDECVREFLRDFGIRVWRRPLTEEEVNRYLFVVGNVEQLFAGDTVKGVELAVAGLLQSPNFLYRVELGEALEDDPNVRKYTDFEMASRLAYTLWETTPDDELIEAAERGQLSTGRRIARQVDRMLDDPRADAALARFWREHLNVDRLTLTNYPKPGATEDLYAAMRAEGRALAQQMIDHETDALDFLITDRATLRPELADFYGLDPIAEETEVTMPGWRRGYLTSGLFLATNGHPDKTSPTRRGKFVVERILCGVVPPPPADVDLSLPTPPEGEATRREALEAHRDLDACRGCHEIMDPVSFSFANFGPFGEFRELDNGLPVDASGEFRGQNFEVVRELIPMLRDAAGVSRCLVQHAYRNAIGQIETDAQLVNINELTAVFEEEDGRVYRALVREIVSSDAFRYASGQLGNDDLSGEGEGE